MNYVKISPATTVKEATEYMQERQQNCAFVVDIEDFLEGILTCGDIRRWLSKKSTDATKESMVSDVSYYKHSILKVHKI